MTSYRLLRSNRESGPHSFDQLLAFGLKPYDLVWVNGKSAAWRYPSEIEELRSYVPGDVEQPFDRFYKKPAETNLPLFPQQEPRQERATVQTVPTPQPIPVYKDIRESVPVQPQPKPLPVQENEYAPKEFSSSEQQFIPRKSVYVTMPGKKSEVGSRESEVRSQESEVLSESPEVRKSERRFEAAQRYMPLEPESEPPTISITENPATAKIKYSQPLDEIKDMYVKTLQQRKDKIARQTFFKINLKRVAVIAGLIGIGALAGYLIKSGDAKSTIGPLAQSPKQAVTSLIETPPESKITEPVANPLAQNVETHASAPVEESKSARINNQQPAPKMDLPVDKPREKAIAKPSADNKQQEISEKVAYSPAEINSQTGERNRSVRTEIPQEKNVADPVEAKPVRKTSKSVLGTQVYVTTNDYKRVAFGGIRNLELTVTNNSKYQLDNVLVELQYLKPSEEPLKIETIRFTGVAPNESATIRVPDTNRGIKVEYKIISIGSRQLNADMANN